MQKIISNIHLLIGLCLLVAGLTVHQVAHAAAGFDMYIDTVGESVVYEKVTSADPGSTNGDECVTIGATQGWSGPWAAETAQPAVMTLGPPFSGSASKTSYLSLSACSSDNSQHGTGIYRLDIQLTDCDLWVCNTNYNVTQVRISSGVDICLDLKMFLTAALRVKCVNFD